MNAEGGVGTDSRLKAKAFALRYDEYSRVAVFANLNNTNENRTPGTDGDWSPSKQTKGQLTTKQAGVNFNLNNARKTLSVDNSALFEWSDHNVVSQERSEKFAAGGSVWGGSNASNVDKDYSFTDDLNLSVKMKRSLITSQHHLNYSSGETETESADSTYRSSLINMDRYLSGRESKVFMGNGSLGWSYATNTPYSLSLYANYMFSDRSRDNAHILRNTHYIYNNTTDTRNDYRDSRAQSYRYSVSAEHKYAFSQRFNASYHLAYNQKGQGQLYDYFRLNDRREQAGDKVTYRKGTLSLGGVVKYEGRFSHEEEYGSRDMNVHEYSVGGNAQYTVPVLKLTVGTDVTLYSQKGYDADFMNTDDVVWNAFLSRPLFKGMMVAKVEMYDILHQLSNRKYRVDAQSRVETYYNSVPHYAMFSLSYKLVKKPRK